MISFMESLVRMKRTDNVINEIPDIDEKEFV